MTNKFLFNRWLINQLPLIDDVTTIIHSILDIVYIYSIDELLYIYNYCKIDTICEILPYKCIKHNMFFGYILCSTPLLLGGNDTLPPFPKKLEFILNNHNYAYLILETMLWIIIMLILTSER